MKIKSILLISALICTKTIYANPQITLLEHFNNTKNIAGQQVVTPEYPDTKFGKINGDVKFVDTRFGKGVLCSTYKDNVTFGAKGIVNPARGTVEAWITPSVDLETVKTNQQVFKIKFDNNNAISLYYNAKDNNFVFYIVDKDDPSSYHHSKGYPIIQPTVKVFWKKGQSHHIAVSWSDKVQFVFLDGKMACHAYFNCAIKTSVTQSSKVFISGEGGDSCFIFDEFRIWDDVRAPRKLDVAPVYVDTNFDAKNPTCKRWLNAKNISLGFNKDNALPMAIKPLNSKTSWTTGASSLEADKKLSKIITWSQKDGVAICTVKFNNKTEADITTDVALKFPMLKASDMAFIPVDDGVFKVGTGRTTKGYIKGARYGVNAASIPLISIYRPEIDAGLTIISSLDDKNEIKWDLGDENKSNILSITHKKIKIPAGQSKQMQWMFAGHQADWRCALDVYTKIYPGILVPPQGAVAKGDQGMVIGGRSNREFLKELVDLGVGWREVSMDHLGKGANEEGRLPIGFGNYIPDDLTPYQQNIEAFRQSFVNMDKAGIDALLYIQARDCQNLEQALRDFPDSVQYYSNGKPMNGVFGATMTCEKGSKWYLHLIDQAKRQMSVFPNADGFFFDNSWNPEFADIIEAIAKVAHDAGRSMTTNGASAKCVEFSDSIMAETHLSQLGNMQYLGLVTPIHYIPIYIAGAPLDAKPRHGAPGVMQNLKRDLGACLVRGGFYSFNSFGTKYWSQKSITYFKQYLPLQKALYGRKWVLSAHALELPDKLKGNVFEARDGAWLVALAKDAYDAGAAVIKVRVPDTSKVLQQVLIRKVGESWAPIAFSQIGQDITINLKEIPDLSLLKLYWQ